MKQNNDIAELLSGFFSGTLSPQEKAALYHYVADDSHKGMVIAWLKSQWDNAPQQVGNVPGEAMFEKIRMEIEKQATMTASSRQVSIKRAKVKNRKSILFVRYAAIFVLAFGISWVVQKSVTNSANLQPATPVSLQYNEILVPYGSKTMVVLPDSTKVWLNAGARLKYPTHFDNTLREVHLQGEAYFDVTKDSEHPFFVNSNGMNIKVLGTKFNLMANADDNQIEATLEEGAIEVLGLKDANSDAKSNVVLAPGQKLTLQKESGNYKILNVSEAGLVFPERVHTPVKIKSANVSENANMELTTAWRDNKLVFVKERFEDVKTKLERWYGVNIEVKNPEVLEYRFTGTFDKETFEQAMTALSKAASCSFRVDRNKVVVTKIKSKPS